MKKLFSILVILSLIATLALPVFAANETKEPEQSLDKSIAADAAKDKSAAASEAKDAAKIRAGAKAIRGKLSGLFDQLTKLRAEGKDLWSQLKESNKAIKAAWVQFKESLKGKEKAEIEEIIKAKKAALEPLRTKVTTIRSEIKTLREQKEAEWASFKAAVKEKDEVKAAAALNNIIRLKSQIIEKQKLLLPLKQQILAAIK